MALRLKNESELRRLTKQAAPAPQKPVGKQIRPKPAEWTPTEHEEQVALIQWRDKAKARRPEVGLLFAIANAGAGARKGQCGKMVGEGVTKGVPDLCLPVARGEFHGLFIELKRKKGGRLSTEQAWWMAALIVQGYRARVAYGADEAIAIILAYLEWK